MLVEIRNHLIDLTLVSCISDITDELHIGWNQRIKSFDIYLLNIEKPLLITSKIYNINNIDQTIIDEFEALHTKIVNFWQIAKNQSNIIKLDS